MQNHTAKTFQKQQDALKDAHRIHHRVPGTVAGWMSKVKVIDMPDCQILYRVYSFPTSRILPKHVGPQCPGTPDIHHVLLMA